VDSYAIYRDGSLVGTSTTTRFTDTGLTPGDSYSYRVSAIDVAGNESARSSAVSESVPLSTLWISVTPSSLDLGYTDPGDVSSVASAAVVSVGGVGNASYDLYCSADDFMNADTGATMPTLPAGALSFAGRGFATIPSQPFVTSPTLIHTAAGSKYRWGHDYVFDYTFTVPWEFEAGTYSTTVVYTVVPD
jgi:hypothetical protein